MAEIRVEPKKRSLAWLWVLLALAAVALVAWYLNNDGVDQIDVAPATSMAPAPGIPAIGSHPATGAFAVPLGTVAVGTVPPGVAAHA